MEKFHGSYLTPTKYRDAYIAAKQQVDREKANVESVKTRMMLGDVEEYAELEKADVEEYAELEKAEEKLKEAKREAERLYCLWTTGREPEDAAIRTVWKNQIGQVCRPG